MQASTSACCPGQQPAGSNDAADTERFGLPSAAELADDPVLAGCCAEDLANMRRGEQIRNALLAVDRTTARLKLQAQALPMPPEQRPRSASPPLDSDEEDDPVLLELRQQRLAEIQRQAAERQQRSRHGYGALNDVAAGALLTCALLDEHLASLAHRHTGTFFVRVVAHRADPLGAKLRMQDLPGGWEEEWRLKPCEVCGRRYPHEHVPAVYGRRGSSGDSDGSED
ncbi:hypothetical protein TSOC_006669 [Tetrabaena socialis]|uniref:Uncharacterized protein n=1 Tax=Tetrabaena socialis TaxID=47790 RepID=A0A2J8A303_9CHLO|nr:hypothetical protein TSOC_006669 [Tetrabaena socialis]|eukprot:PNH06907.1 hypothetical protein TSOC_006669 [Tetrabaena socialis]